MRSWTLPMRSPARSTSGRRTTFEKCTTGTGGVDAAMVGPDSDTPKCRARARPGSTQAPGDPPTGRPRGAPCGESAPIRAPGARIGSVKATITRDGDVTRDADPAAISAALAGTAFFWLDLESAAG